MQDIFHRIFQLHHWYNEESFSGPGSSLSQTETLRKVFPKIISDLKINSILDIPCGDFNWMNEMDLSMFTYCGADIVKDIVDRNNIRYSTGNKQFVWADITSSNLPQYDLVFCRDCLVHFSYADIKRAISIIRKSRSTYLLTTTFPDRVNEDIATGEWRPINFEAAPFFFPPPIKMINENCTEEYGRYADKSLGLWIIDSLPKIE